MLDAFYGEVLPTVGYKIVASLKHGPKHYATNDPRKTIDALDKQDLNTYITLGGYLEGAERITAENEVTFLQGSCPYVKAFAFDLDVEKEGENNPKKYASIDDAFTALKAGVKSGVVPIPRWIVHSGGGLHFYYVLGHVVTEDQWAPICAGLRTAFTDSGLRIDRAVGTYPYRLIRAPGTRNHKFDPPRLVTLHDHRGPIHTLDQLRPFCAEPKAKTYPDAQQSAYDKVDPEQLFSSCARLEYIRQTQCKDVQQPEWFALANIITHTTGGEELFCELSSGHANYNREYVVDFYNRVASNYGEGPSHCREFQSEECKGCKHFEKSTNPIKATRDDTPLSPEIEIAFNQTYVPPDPDYIDEDFMPDGFTREGDGLFFHDNLVSTYFKVGRAQFNSVTQTASAQLTRHTGDVCLFPLKALGREASVASELANLGIRVLEADAVTMYIKDISLKYAPLSEHVSLGWTEDLTRFIAPNGIIPTGDTLMASHNLRKITEHWSGQQGDFDLWVRALGMLQYSGQEPMLMCVLCSLASPLMKYLKLEEGVIYSMQGAKGMGKSTAMKIANSVWGEPLISTVKSNDTYMAIRKKIALSGNLPMTIDETTKREAEELQTLAFEISQGAGRSRLQKTGDLAEEEKWQLIAISNSNNSIHKKLLENPVGDGADLTRVFEVTIDKKKIHEHPKVSADEGQIMSDKIEENYGHMGEQFILWLLQQDKEHLISTARKLRRALKQRYALDGSFRYYECLIVACHLAHKAAKEIHKDFPGDTRIMYEWMQMQLANNKSGLGAMIDLRMPTPDNFLIEFEQDGNIKRISEAGTFEVWGTSFKGSLYQFDDGVYVPIETFKAWCHRQNVPHSDLQARWADQGHLVPVRYSEGKEPIYAGKSPKGIKMQDGTLYPSVIIVHRDENAQITESIQNRIKQG